MLLQLLIPKSPPAAVPAAHLLRSMLKKSPLSPRCSVPPAVVLFLLLPLLGLLSSLRRG